VCFGPNTALPHHRTDATQLVAGSMVILDLGGCLDGYQSDITRTVAYGQVSDEAAHIYDIVYEAHVAAMEAARPGVTCESVDAAARNTIAQAGYGPNFIHRTGHGIGLSTHEPPNLVEGDRTVLQPGMCFSDEPGIYLSGRFGVRIENIITITGTGSRSLNHPAPSRLPVLE
ncbi:MAG: M24 family metallopeptidase, partial [Chthonomonadales bacterium]|nr:M24 family metallopeptidase [Chthonomonadales bacterium]